MSVFYIPWAEPVSPVKIPNNNDILLKYSCINAKEYIIVWIWYSSGSWGDRCRGVPKSTHDAPLRYQKPLEENLVIDTHAESYQ